MQTGIRLLAQCYDIATGKIIDESILRDEALSKAETINELGYLHVEQIDFLKKIQDFKISRQIILNCLSVCPVCKSKTKKAGVFKSKFHAALTDHSVIVQRTSCKCGWYSASSIEGIYGSSIHPDLLEKQALQGSKESYEKSSKSLNAESAKKRPINSHSQIYKSVRCVGEALEKIKTSVDYANGAKPASTLVINIDGGHIKAKGEHRSFEAMIVTVYNPANLKEVDKNHNTITSKTIVASAKDDHQETIEKLFKTACKVEGMTPATTVTCLADGAENCWSIAHSLGIEYKKIDFVLDWFHIAMKFQNISISNEYKELYSKVKWHLWRGDPDVALARLEQLKLLITDVATVLKLNKLSNYINNNKEKIVNYGVRRKNNLPYTSNLAETTVNTLINERQKGKKKMLWSRDGAHNILQVRSSVFSNTWNNDWKKIESIIYRKAA